MKPLCVRLASWAAFSISQAVALGAPDPSLPPAYLAGAARVEITPEHPVRLSGYGNRRREANRAEQRIFARALALGIPGGPEHVLVSVESCGVPSRVSEEVALRLERKRGIARARVAVVSTHTHTAPMVSGVLATLFGEPVPPDHLERIELYTRQLTDAIERAALEALARLAPARLAWGKGRGTFARNRRTPGGPAEHDLPLLAVRGEDGALTAAVVGYACHATALGGEFNAVCGDWPGYAQEFIEAEQPGAVALVVIGCGADADPHPRTGLEHAIRHGREIASEAGRLLGAPLAPLSGALDSKLVRIHLPLEALPPREEWERRAALGGAVGYHAQVQLDRIERGEMLATEVEYPIQTWSFGHELVMVFLAGEVVVDYSLRLERELDPRRLWVVAYANDVPCYIPSRRIHAEGGYEGGGAMVYYDLPARLDAGVEDRIVDTVHALVPPEYRSEEMRAEYPQALDPDASLGALRVKPGLRVELVASEPLVVDPVAIDFDSDGRLWVVEMRDYPTGIDGAWSPGGRVTRLEDSDGDGRFDRSSAFLEGLPFPTGVMAWRRGVLICAAPDIIYAEDGDGDGRAETRQTLFTGFSTENYQARVNGLAWGLDNLVHAAAGLFEARVRCLQTGASVELGRQDFRFDPDRGLVEPAGGLSQQGRARDDWGNWFGNENWFLLRHYSIPHRYVRRNPHIAPPPARIDVPQGPDPNRLYPASRILRRFNDPEHAGRTTSACGPCIYRDHILGPEFYGNAFVCEPVHNLVHRMVLEPDGVTFRGRRATGERDSEFLASTDNWFRPVQVLTGPDGALWVVDMYRFVIEHPRWIPKERLALLDVRAGSDRGRLYRVLPASGATRELPRLSRLPAHKLAARLESANGPLRDAVHRELVHRRDPEAVPVLSRLARASDRPAVRVQALSALEGLEALDEETLLAALEDSHPEVARRAVWAAEDRVAGSERVARALAAIAGRPEPALRFQLALSLGEWPSARAADVLARLAGTATDDPWLRRAVLSSAVPHASRLLAAALDDRTPAPPDGELLAGLVATATATAAAPEIARVLVALARNPGAGGSRRLSVLAAFLEGLERRSLDLAALAASDEAAAAEAVESVVKVLAEGRRLAADGTTALGVRADAMRLLGRYLPARDEDLDTLEALVHFREPVEVQRSAVAVLSRIDSVRSAQTLVRALRSLSPEPCSAALDVLASRSSWALVLLDAVASEEVPRARVPVAHRARLLAHPDEAVRERARGLFSGIEDRRGVLDAYRPALSAPGDRAPGALIFAKLCASCHAFGGQGRDIGPDLAALSGKGADFLLESILDPNAAVEGKYQVYEVVLRDGRVESGMLRNESATGFEIVRASGLAELVLRRDILHLEGTGKSLMPEGLEQSIDSRDAADLLAYLRTPPRVLGSTSGEEASRARARFLEEGVSGLDRVLASWDRLAQESWLGRVPMHYCRQTDGTAAVLWETDPVPAELDPAAFHRFRLPAAMGWRSQPEGGFALLLGGRRVLEFDVALEDRVWESSDARVRMTYTVLERNAEDSTGVLALDIHASLLEPGKAARLEVKGSAAGSQRWFGVLLCPRD